MKRLKKYMWIALSIIAILTITVIVFINQDSFGKVPFGESLERIEKSPNYKNGKFQNTHETPQMTSDKSFVSVIFEFLFKKKYRVRPTVDLPIIETNLWELNINEDILVWFGHSSYFLQIDGKRILVDPVLNGAASPSSFVNKSFRGADSYKPEDIPEIDYLIISHDHWDHLDYETVMNLKDRVAKIICGLGVGEHFLYWGYDKNKIIELDWGENISLNDGFAVHCLPARHFSGRGLSPNQSLWASYLLQTSTQNIYIGGDSGYDTHYVEIGKQFKNIDLAILENGQYDESWKYVHLLPEQLIQAFNDLGAKKLFTVHHSKYALGNHPWDEPLKNVSSFAEKDSISLIQPMIGEVVNLQDSTYTINKWWEEIQ